MRKWLLSFMIVVAVAACGESPEATSATPAAQSAHSSAHSAPLDSSTTTESTAPAVAPPHNAADVTFAQHMIPHHAQAVAMSEAALQRAATPEVRGLARQIRDAQQPEIDRMTAFLTSWGQPVEMPGAHGGDTHASMPGMMAPAEMAQLEQATGRDFDRRFLQMMIRHHEGAVAMAATELTEGVSPEAKALATSITAEQQREIARMRELLLER